MSLAVGTRLGPYEVTALIGAGGMGEVYKARDTRLGRSVAIKILPSDAAADPVRRRRFEQEARAVSALNHPHICTLHDIGSDGGSDYLVMEYLDGQTLAERLAKGALPLAQALEYAIQIADALANAHRHAIVHRDLKPRNIMLTKEGAKLLDFGLARLTQASGASGASATLSAAGTVVGTVPYMAPEQVQGRETDARTDLFAFGAVLYEMVTGARAFKGDSAASVTAAILEHDPAPISSLQPLTPPALERLVKKCVAKDPDARWQSAADLRDELRWLASDTDDPHATGARAAAARTSPRRRWRSTAALSALVLLVAAGGLLLGRAFAPRPASALLRLQLSPSTGGFTLTDGGLAISPDGQTIVFAAREGDVTRLYARRLDEWTTRVLPGTEEASEPFFSPDGDWIGFVDRAGGLEEVRLREGPAQPIWKPDQRGLDRMTGATWGPGGIVFGRWPSPALCSVSPDGGAARVLVSSPGTAVWYLWPEALPGGRAVLFTIWQRGRMSIASLSLDSGKVQPLVASGSRPRYLATGHLLYESDGKIFAVAFDPETLQIHGHAIAIVPEVPKSAWWGSWRASTTGAPYGVSSSGTLAYTPAPATLPALVWIDRRGIRTPLPLEPRQYSMPTLSPDGRLIADTIYDGPSRSVWISSVEGGSMMRLTSGPDDCYSLFTPDGKWLLFTSNQDSRYNIFRIPVDRSAPAERMTDSPHSQRATSWSPPDGKTLLFNDVDETTGYDILALTNGAVRPFLQTRYSERAACFSPDGRWVAYESDEYGGPEIFVQAYPSGARTPVSSGGGVGWPAWRRNELFYQGPKGVMCVRIADGRPLGLPVLLFPHKSEFRDWDVSPDGQRFLMVEGAETSRFPPHINVVTNWFDELKAKVPTPR